MFGRVGVVLISTVLLSYLRISESACEGTLGTVQNTFYTRNSSIYVTWNPPLGWEDCDGLKYEIRWTDYADNATFFVDTTSQTQYVFHYAAANFFCQIFGLEIIAKYNNINGELHNTVVVGDNFTSVVVDPVQSLRIQELGNHILVRWEPSTQFRACWANVYDVQIFDGDRLVSSWRGQREFYSFNYKAENLCDIQLLIKVTAMFRDFPSSTLTRMIVTGSC